LTVDNSSLLGSGNYGIVRRGRLRHNREEEISVAVKLPKQTSFFRCSTNLYTELVILSRIMPHQNIVSLLGAVVAGIREGKPLTRCYFINF